MLDNHKALRALGLEFEDIVKIAANIGGSKTLKSVLVNHKALTALGLESEDIVNIAANGGGSQAIHNFIFVNEALNNKDPFLDGISVQDNTDTTNGDATLNGLDDSQEIQHTNINDISEDGDEPLTEQEEDFVTFLSSNFGEKRSFDQMNNNGWASGEFD